MRHQFSNHLNAESARDASIVRSFFLRNKTELASRSESILVLLNHSRDLTKRNSSTEKRKYVVEVGRIVDSDIISRHDLSSIVGDDMLRQKQAHNTISRWSLCTAVVSIGIIGVFISCGGSMNSGTITSTVALSIVKTRLRPTVTELFSNIGSTVDCEINTLRLAAVMSGCLSNNEYSSNAVRCC